MIQNSLPGPKMIFISGGTYWMGERGDLVTVVDFYMDETPVTVAQYREAVRAGACSIPVEVNKNQCSNWGAEGRENHPVNCIDWHQACAYAKWAGKRLPTEEEWEWAARGGDDGRMYPWGSEAPSDQLCWDGEGNELGRGRRWSTSPVGSYPKGDSKHGLKDMAGNVWEWISSTSKHKVISGGSWSNYNPIFVRASISFYNVPIKSYEDVGFRCVRDV